MTPNMPHSIDSESTPAEGSSAATSQVENIKTEPDTTHDIAMEDAPTPPATEKSKVNLEELFDDDDSDEEFSSSAQTFKSEEELSQAVPMCVSGN